MITKQICIEEILDAPLNCGSVEPTIQWIIPNSDCMETPCIDCSDECIEVTMDEECSSNYIQVVLTYPGSSCPDIVRNIGLCTNNSDCSACDVCDEGVCVEKCEGPCDNFGLCVDCINNSQCDGDKVCINGNCQCPSGTTDIGGGVCAECFLNEDCLECERCINNKCIPTICPGGVCLENQCVECIKSGDCNTNECCEGNNCVCCKGYEKNYTTGICEPIGECFSADDCGDCRECINGNCVEKICPEGYACYEGECYKKCSQQNPVCDDPNLSCLSMGDVSICIDCPECEESSSEEPGEGSASDPSNPSNPGNPCSITSDCGPGQICDGGACVDCESCPEEPCIESFQINTDSDVCKVEGILDTTNTCNCPQITWSAEVHEIDGDLVKFRFRLRQGNAFINGINNIPLLRDLGIDNPYSIIGEVKIKTVATGLYEDPSLGEYHETKDRGGLSFSGTDEIVTSFIKLDKPGSSCIQTSTGKKFFIDNVNIVFTIPSMSIQMEDGCSYTIEQKEISYSINKNGGNGYLSSHEFYEEGSSLLKYYVLTGVGERNPIFHWYSGNSPETSVLVRKVYSSRISSNRFRDAWLGSEEGIETGKYLRLESDCSCGGKTYFKCLGTPERLYYCSPDIEELNYEITDCNTKIEFSDNEFQVCHSNINQGYELHINGEEVSTFYPDEGTLSIEGSYSFEDPILTIQIKLEGVECEDCYPIENVEISEYNFEFNSYDCQTQELSVSISGGSGNYRFLVDDEEWVIGDPITLVNGNHLFRIEDNINGCYSEFTFEVDCCDIFKITEGDLNVCDSKIDSFTFEVSGGSSDYEWTAYESKGGTQIDSGISSSEEITFSLNDYDKDRIFIVVTDLFECRAENTFKINYQEEVDVEVSNRSFCDDDTETEVTISVLSGQLPISYILKQGVATLDTGSFTSNNSLLEIENPNDSSYTLELEDNNECGGIKPFVLNPRTCPNPEIAVDPKTICQGKDLIITATISNGTNPYSWNIEYNSSEIYSGGGPNVSYNTGIIYSSDSGTYTFTINVIDVNGKEDTKQVTYTVLDELDEECVDCSEEPTVEITSDKGWIVEENEIVELSLNISGESYTWFVNGQPEGYNDLFYPSTSQSGAYSIYAEIEYEPGCYTVTGTKTLNVSEPCGCEYAIKLLSGWGGDNNKEINQTTKGSPAICFGDKVTAEAIEYNCSNNITYDWKVERNGQTITSQSNKTFTWIPDLELPDGEYSLILSGWDEDCLVPTVTYKRDFNLCRSCNIELAPIPDITICDGEPAVVFASASGIWKVPGGVKFKYIVNGSTYTEFPSGGNNWTCSGQTTCSRNQNITGLSVGTHSAEVEVWENGAVECSDSQTFNIVVRPISHEQCRNCTSNTANISIVGCSGSGSCNLYSIEGQTTTLNASATGSPGGFTYQWKIGNSNVGSGAVVQVGPHPINSNITYTIVATDSHGCEFTRSAIVKTTADCIGTPQVIVNKTEACQGESINISWNLDALYNKEQYTVSITRWVGNSGYTMVTGRPWNGSYNTSMIDSNVEYQINVERRVGPNVLCTNSSSRKLVELASCIDCTGTISSITASKNTLCPTETVNLTANINGNTSGWSYVWERIVPGNATQIGTGLSVSNYLPPQLPVTVRVTGTKSGCTTSSKQISISDGGVQFCCNPTPTRSLAYDANFCTNKTIRINVTNISGWDTKLYKGSSCSGTVVGEDETTYTITNAEIGDKYTFCWDDPKCSINSGSQTFTVAQQPSCCTLAIDPKVVMKTPTGGDDEACVDGTVDLKSNVTGSETGWTYKWIYGGQTIGTTKDINNWSDYNGVPFSVRFEAEKEGCSTLSKTINVVESSVCCAGKPTSVNSSSGTSLCPGDSTTLTAVTGDDSGWTYEWRLGDSPLGIKFGDGKSFTLPSMTYLPYIASVWGKSPYCPGVHGSTITITKSSTCCPSGITLQKICDPNEIQIRVNGLQTQDKVQFDNGPIMLSPHPNNRRVYTWDGTGVKSGVKIKVFRDTCPEEDNYEFNVELIR